MVLQLATHTSVRKAPTLSKVLLMYLLRSKRFDTSWLIYNNLPATHITMLYITSDEALVWSTKS